MSSSYTTIRKQGLFDWMVNNAKVAGAAIAVFGVLLAGVGAVALAAAPRTEPVLTASVECIGAGGCGQVVLRGGSFLGAPVADVPDGYVVPPPGETVPVWVDNSKFTLESARSDSSWQEPVGVLSLVFAGLAVFIGGLTFTMSSPYRYRNRR